MVTKLSLVLAALVAATCLVACGDNGPNDPGMTSADLQKVRAAAQKQSDGVTPGSGQVGENGKKLRK